MITPERTTVIASTHRMFAIAEKSAMGDGRFNDERVRRAVRELSRRHVLTDLGKVAERAGTVLSSVLLGAIAGSGALPISRERLRGAIERAGIAVEANQRGFDAGYRLFDDEAVTGPDADGRCTGANRSGLRVRGRRRLSLAFVGRRSPRCVARAGPRVRPHGRGANGRLPGCAIRGPVS